MKTSTQHFLKELLERYPILETCKTSIWDAFLAMTKSYESGGKLLICGNGGSAADADHISGELLKGFRSKRPLDDALKNKINDHLSGDDFVERLQYSLPAIALPNNNGIISAVCNDIGADLMYAQQVMGLCLSNDILLGISTSGNADNIMKAVAVAKAKGAYTIVLTGKTGGKLAQFCDLAIRVPSDSTPEIQELHLPFIMLYAQC